MSSAFVPIVRTRPCPIFGRPVHPELPPRLRPDPSPHAFRIPPHGRHPALPCDPSDHQGQPASYTSFRICYLSLRPQRDFNPPEQSTARHTLRALPTPCRPPHPVIYSRVWLELASWLPVVRASQVPSRSFGARCLLPPRRVFLSVSTSFFSGGAGFIRLWGIDHSHCYLSRPIQVRFRYGSHLCRAEASGPPLTQRPARSTTCL